MCDEKKEEKIDNQVKNFVVKGRTLAVTEDWLNRFDKLRVIDSLNNEGTNSLVMDE